MPLEHLTYTPDCRKFKVTQDGQDTGQRVLKTFMGRKNVDLGDGVFAPYVWDEPSQSIRYGELSCEFYSAGYQIIREFGSIETLIDDQRFEVQYWDAPQWRTLDLWQIGLTVDQQDEHCVITRNLSDGDGNTLDVEFLFRPFEKVKNTFRLHVVNANLYRIRFQNSGIAGDMVEVPTTTLSGDNLGIYKLLFDNIKFQWDSDEIDIHSNYTVEDQAGGKKLDIFIGAFSLSDNDDIVVSPDTWGPTTVTDADDGFEQDDTTWYDDNVGYIVCGDFEDSVLDSGLMWTVTDTDLPGATINTGTKINIDVTGVDGSGCDAILKLIDNRSPGTWGSSNRPSQLTKHTSVTVDWDEGSTGSQDSPELNLFIQQRIDGDDGADPFESGDKLAFVWEDVNSAYNQRIWWLEGDADLTIVFTPASGTTKVTSDLELVYDGYSRITSDSESLFDVYNKLASDVELVFDVYNKITSDVELVYDQSGRTTSDSESVFDIFNKINSDIETVYDVRNKISSDAEAVFDIFNKVSSDLELVYDTWGWVISDIEAVFDIFSVARSDVEMVFDIINTVRADSIIVYDQRESVSSDMEAVYDQAGQVSSDSELVYDVKNIISSDIEGVFDVLNSIYADITLKYDQFEKISSDIEAVFDVVGKVTSDSELVYDMIGRIDSSIEFVFDVLNKINADSVLKYDVYHRILSDLELVYDQFEKMDSDLEAVYDIYNKVNSDLEALFDVLNKMNSDSEHVFDINIKTLSDLELVFDIESTKALSDANIVYDVFSDAGAGKGLNRLGLSTRLD
ncbi:MAG: hypothetical protein JRG81_00125 [Deltaproteobacteria bacterium]|nr:hypothetical protein [Deltaproteobacteria bacterium]MBW2363483.1 hypothetical protein [Deltaproteobacteria bacterium]